MTTLLATSTKVLAPSLGVLLSDFRTGEGESTKTVSRRCALGPVEIAQLELGRADMSADELADAVAAYAVPRQVFPEGRSEVRVDLVAGSISVHISDTVVEETSADRTLLVYLELIFAPSQMSPTTAIPFTALDLNVLRLVLSSRRAEVTSHLEQLLAPSDDPSVVSRRPIMRGALLVLTAAATVMATLAVVDAVRGTGTAPQTVVNGAPPAPAAVQAEALAPVVGPIDAQIFSALVIERGASVATTAGTLVESAKGPK